MAADEAAPAIPVEIANLGAKIMADDIRLARAIRELEQDFVANYDAQNMPAADKRAAYALESLAFRVGRIDQKLEQLIAVLTVLTKP